MKKRGVEKKSSSINIKYFFGNTVCSCLATAFVTNKLLIQTKMCLPIFARFDIYFLYNEKLEQVTVQVEKVIRENTGQDIMIVDVLNQHKNFRKLVDTIIAGKHA